jgi:hypothetical protein
MQRDDEDFCHAVARAVGGRGELVEESTGALAAQANTAVGTTGHGSTSPAPDGDAGELETVAHAGLLEDVGAVPVDGLRADGESVGDLAGGVAFGDQFDDLLFAKGEDAGWETVALQSRCRSGSPG